MTGQKGRIFRRFVREAKRKYKKMQKVGVHPVYVGDKPNWHLVGFTLDEIENIIYLRDEDEKRG